MDREQTTDQPWDREQLEPDVPRPDATDQGEVWNRHQIEVDNTGTDLEGTGREAVDLGTATDADAGTSDMDSISGRGKPSGESHWDRTDKSSD